MQKRTNRNLAGAVATGALLIALPAKAQTPADTRTGVAVFDSAFFADSAPANAAEMVTRLPGFTLMEGDADVRGYAGAQGNVLIDGVRPTSKRESLDDLLERIPAASVERIELIRSGGSGIDMDGHAVLANVVRRDVPITEGAVELEALAATDGWLGVGGQVEYARRSGDRALELALKIEPELDDDSGVGVIRSSGSSGGAVERQDLDTRTIGHQLEASALYGLPFASGAFTATAAVRGERVRTTADIRAVAADAERIDEDEDFSELELGARYSRRLGDRTALELVASQQIGRLDGREASHRGPETELFTETTRTAESIARLDLTQERSAAWSFAAGLEGAVNTLESSALLEANGAMVDLPGSDVRIEERRAEASAGATWRPQSGWIIDAEMRIEASRIGQSGDSPLERSFVYFKPRLATIWDMDANNQLRVSLSGEVGQLDFGEFVASASLDTGQVTAGNALLEPDKTWRLAAAWEHRFWTDASLTLTWTHDEISDVVDRILVVTPTDVFDAPGNIGEGRRDTFAVDLLAPLDRLGVTGGQARASLLWRTSAVVDPITGETRDISDENPFDGSIEISQALPALRLNWGVEIEHINERSTEYRFDEVTQEREGLGWTLYAERRLGQRWRLRAEVTDLFGRDFAERRESWDGPRSAAPRDRIETRERETPGFVSLTLRRSMGG